MRNSIVTNEIKVVGIDLAKESFQLHGVNEQGHVIVRKKLSRRKLMLFMTHLPPCLVGMEACGGAHDWARKFRTMGHDVRLMSPQFVKPYVKSNKNDEVDAEAVCEAVQRPNMRFVPIKSIEQQDIQSLHRARSLAVSHRTAQLNQIRGFLMEYGLVAAKGVATLRKALPGILEDADNALSPMFRELLSGLQDEFHRLDERIAAYDLQIKQLSAQSDACRRLMTIPGVGPMISTILVAAVADAKAFKNGREMSAWLGLVPRQHSTGGKPKLLGISKHGDAYLRTMLIHGARSDLLAAKKKQDRRSQWAVALEARRGQNIAAVALANKIVRTAWALLSRGGEYKVTAA
ncbi:IS110 family transposase [Mariprofundus erugo]|uniref:IS110 family transposase n=2 Tax=Mariprofundus erugo TaxID=2528639 RepID=A0A5R9GKL2_9PROT|nr:IS110 family transposase [Mariprofundus erugo]TLS65715.1 IS110 family transposase [Mariprofundus erugo]